MHCVNQITFICFVAYCLKVLIVLMGSVIQSAPIVMLLKRCALHCHQIILLLLKKTHFAQNMLAFVPCMITNIFVIYLLLMLRSVLIVNIHLIIAFAYHHLTALLAML